MTTPVQLLDTSYDPLVEGRTKAAPRHKVAFVIWTAIFPTVFVLSTLLSLLPAEMPRILSVFVITSISVPATVYLLLPSLCRLFDPWIYKEARTAARQDATAPSSTAQGSGVSVNAARMTHWSGRGAMQAFLRFNGGVMRMSTPVRLWILLMVTANMVIPLFFVGQWEAQVVLAVFVASVVLMMTLTAVSGFTRLLGLGHVFWFPLLWLLWTRLDDMPIDTFLGLWLRVLIAVNALSLVVDTADVIRYIAGDREETVQRVT